MPKTITFSNIKIKEFSISRKNGEWTISLSYSLLDESGKEWDAKRIDFKGEDFTTFQKGRLQQIMTFLITKIKTKEEI